MYRSLSRRARRHPFGLGFAAILLVAAAPRASAQNATANDHPEKFVVAEEAEVVATLTASCEACDWGVPSREAAVVRIDVDGAYSQHLYLYRGAAPAEYRIQLGRLTKGPHEISIARDEKLSAPRAGAVHIARVSFEETAPGTERFRALSHAPVLHARPNTLGRFSDVPLLLWYETERTARGSRIRYSVVFSNEDGGTPPDRLLATWGRLTDLEYVYGIEVDSSGRTLDETYQGKDHEILPFRGSRSGSHPLLYVVTDNNMVTDKGEAKPRFAPAPIPADLSHASREIVMDQHPWTYAVTAQEARREGRVVETPVRGSKKIADPRSYAVVEACSRPDDLPFSTFSFSIGVKSPKGPVESFDSTNGVSEFRISRSPDHFPNGCFRGAVALPRTTSSADLVFVRFRAEKRKARKGDPEIVAKGPAHIVRVNRVFLMTGDDQPGPNLFEWRGEETAPLGQDGPAFHLRK